MVWNCSSLSISTKVHLYQALIKSVLLYGTETDPFGRWHEYTGRFPHECQWQILDVCWWVHVSNAEVLQWSGLPTIGDILRHRRLSLAMLHAWTLEYQHMMLCVWWWTGYLRRQKGNGQLENAAGLHSQRLAQQGSGGCQLTLYCHLRCGDLRSQRVTERRNSSLGLRDDDDETTTTMVMMMKDDWSQKWRVQAVQNRGCWVIKNHCRGM